MSEDNQENGTANGDVPEIELIIKEEYKIEPSLPFTPVHTIPTGISSSDQYIIFELKTDTEPACSYVIKQTESQLPCDDDIDKLSFAEDSSNSLNDCKRQLNPSPLVINVQIAGESAEEREKKLRRSAQALRQKQLEKAVEAVVNNEMTISKAASTFQVTKSTLWRVVNKHTNIRKKKIDEELNKTIADRICAGESLSTISRSLKVPKSTIHLHKVRLARSGQLPSNVKLRPAPNSAEDLAVKDRIIQAFRACRVNGMSIRFAARFFSIPPSTLWKHINSFRAAQKAQVVAATVNMKTESVDEVDEAVEIESCDSAGKETQVEEDHNEGRDERTDSNNYTDPMEISSEDGDFLITFDFEAFEKYVKRELE